MQGVSRPSIPRRRMFGKRRRIDRFCPAKRRTFHNILEGAIYGFAMDRTNSRNAGEEAGPEIEA